MSYFAAPFALGQLWTQLGCMAPLCTGRANGENTRLTFPQYRLFSSELHRVVKPGLYILQKEAKVVGCYPNGESPAFTAITITFPHPVTRPPPAVVPIRNTFSEIDRRMPKDGTVWLECNFGNRESGKQGKKGHTQSHMGRWKQRRVQHKTTQHAWTTTPFAVGVVLVILCCVVARNGAL